MTHISKKEKSGQKPMHRLVDANSQTVCNPKETVSNSLNTFFAKLASCIPSPSLGHDFITFLDPSILSSFILILSCPQKWKLK